MKELTLEEAALAWAQGKMVEAMGPSNSNFGLIRPIGTQEKAVYECSVFNQLAGFRFRLAPEPPAKRYRPYTWAELDGIRMLGEQVVRKDRKHRALIIGVLEESVHIGNSHYTFQNLLEEFTWPNGSPCGVEVDA